MGNMMYVLVEYVNVKMDGKEQTAQNVFIVLFSHTVLTYLLMNT